MTRSRSTPQVDEPRNLAPLLIHAAFVLTGVMTTLLDPMLPVLSARWTLNDAQAGYLFTAQFAGSMLGVALSGLVVQRSGYRVTLVAGLGAMAVGAIVLTHALWVGGIAAVFGYGIGLGLAIPTANLLVAEWNPHRRAAALNWLNLCWGMGATGCPFAVAALAASRHTHWFLLGVASALSLVGLTLAVSPVTWPDDSPPEQSGTISSAWRNPFVFLLGSLFFLYVGTESSVGGWVASYAQRMQITSDTRWALAPSLFWGALLAGRAMAPGQLRYIGERELARAGLLIASCGVTALVAAHSMTALLVGVAVTGLGLASVFPINVSLLSLHFGKMAPGVSGAMFALAGLGGATLPWLVGALSVRFGTLKTGLYVPLVGCLTMLTLYSSVVRANLKNPQQKSMH